MRKLNLVTGLLVCLFFLSFMVSVPVEAAEVYPVGEDSFITINLLDRDGNGPIALGAEVENVDFDYYYIYKTDKKVYADADSSLTSDFQKRGSTKIKVFSETPGTYEVTFAFDITYKNDVKPRKIITNKYVLNFCEKSKSRPVVTLYVADKENANSVTAYEENEKVYVPLENTLKFLNITWTEKDYIADQENGKFFNNMEVKDNITYVTLDLLRELFHVESEVIYTYENIPEKVAFLKQ